MKWYIELFSESEGYKKLSSENGNLPANWKDFAITYLRSSQYYGVTRSVSVDSLSFVKDGKTFIDNILDAYGVTEKVRVLIWHKVSDDTFSIFYRGILDLTTYERDKISTDIKVIDSDFVQTLRANEDKQVDISRLTTLEGEAIAAHTWKSVTLTARGVSTPGSSQSIEQDNGTAGDAIYLTPTTSNANPGLIAMNLMGQEYFYQAYEHTEVTGVTLSGYFNFDQQGLGYELTFDIDVTHYNESGVEQSSATVYTTTSSDDTGTITFTATKQTFSMSEGDYLAAYINAYRAEVVPAPIVINYPVNAIFAELTTVERSVSSLVEFDLPFPLFDRMLLILTGKENTLRSTVLGSTLDGYTSNGAAWNFGLASGYMLRGAAKYPAFSFKDLFDSYSKIFALGLGFDYEEGKRVVRVEQLEYFFQRTRVITLPNIKDFKQIYADEWVCNAYAVGYENQEFGEYGGQREFNQQMDFSNKLTTKEDFNLISPFRADGLGIELQRRKSQDDDDDDSDSDNFIIDVKNDSGYTNRSASDAGITNVDGIPDPDSAYNVTISPRHNLMRWGAWLRSALNKFNDESVTFTASEKNIALTYTEDGNNITEAADITISDFDRPIFEPVIYSFTCPITAANINTIESNPRGIIHFSYNNVDYYGFLVKMTVKLSEKQANFEILKAYKFVE